MFKMSDEYNNLCCGINLNCIINDCPVSHIKKCVLVLLAIPCVILCEICFCPPVCLFVVLLPFYATTCTAFMRINFIITTERVKMAILHRAPVDFGTQLNKDNVSTFFTLAVHTHITTYPLITTQSHWRLPIPAGLIAFTDSKIISGFSGSTVFLSRSVFVNFMFCSEQCTKL